MEQSSDSFSDAELYDIIDRHSELEVQHTHEAALYEQALEALWQAVDSYDDHTFIVGRTEYEVSVAMRSMHPYFMQKIEEQDGPAVDDEETEARVIAARQMAAMKNVADTNTLSELVAIRTELYLATEEKTEIDPDTKKLLCAEMYARMDEAEAWLQAMVGDDRQVTTTCEADQWVAVINAAFDGEPFDCHNPVDLALVADILYEPVEDDGVDPYNSLYSELMHYLSGNPEDFEEAYGELGIANIQSLATKLLRIASVFNDDTTLSERDEAIDELLRRSKIKHVSPATIKEICHGYHGQLLPDEK